MSSYSISNPDNISQVPPRKPVCWSGTLIPRYLFRVQLPTSFDIINVDEAQAQCPDSSKAERLGDSLWEHVWEGNPRGSNFMAFTCSLMWAITNALRVAAPSEPQLQDRDKHAPLDEKDIAILVLDTKGFPSGTFTRVWVELNCRHGDQTHDYLLHGSLELRGHCSKTTLAELNGLGLQTICRPLRNHRLYGETIREVNESRLQRYRAYQYVLPYPEEPIFVAAIGMAKIFPVQFEIPMAVVFLSLGVPPSAETVLARLQHEFGGMSQPTVQFMVR